MKPKTIIASLAMAGFAGLLFFNFGNQVGGYMHFQEAAESNARAHVVGQWVEDRPTSYSRADNVFTFYMKDEKGNIRKVRYHNPKPANFEEAEQVVVEGRAKNGAFVAESILVKCPSKYNETKGLQQKASASAAPSDPRRR